LESSWCWSSCRVSGARRAVECARWSWRRSRGWACVGHRKGSRGRAVRVNAFDREREEGTSVPARRRALGQGAARWGMDGGVTQENVVLHEGPRRNKRPSGDEPARDADLRVTQRHIECSSGCSYGSVLAPQRSPNCCYFTRLARQGRNFTTKWALSKPRPYPQDKGKLRRSCKTPNECSNQCIKGSVLGRTNPRYVEVVPKLPL